MLISLQETTVTHLPPVKQGTDRKQKGNSVTPFSMPLQSFYQKIDINGKQAD